MELAFRPEAGCWCRHCWEPFVMADIMDPFHNPFTKVRYHLCPECGNKRCPRATHHDHACTHSNEPGQPGSAYE